MDGKNFFLMMEADSSLRNVILNKSTGRFAITKNSKIVINIQFLLYVFDINFAQSSSVVVAAL
jgi:hypothetical protein